MIRLAVFCLSFVSLFANVEYDIVLLAPKGEELTTESTYWRENSVKINDAGYVFGTYCPKDNWEERYSYVYHQKFGFKKINKIFQSHYEGVKSVNNQGIAVGVYGDNTPFYYYHYEPRHPHIFVFDTATDECYDLLVCLQDLYVDRLCITDDNQVIFNCWDSNHISHTCIYDLNQKSISILQEGELISINSKGQMIGGFEDLNAWFFDPKNGVQELGSLDLFNRWKVNPKFLSEGGVVTGTGRDSHGDEKGFLWSQEKGLESFDVENIEYISGVNDHGHVIGECQLDNGDEYYYYFYQSFFYSREHGFIILDTFGGNESRSYAINNHSQIVGRFENKRNEDVAFVWDIENGMKDLSTLIPQKGGWKQLEHATDINDSGCIVGFGRYYGVDHHFLLIPKK